MRIQQLISTAEKPAQGINNLWRLLVSVMSHLDALCLGITVTMAHVHVDPHHIVTCNAMIVNLHLFPARNVLLWMLQATQQMLASVYILFLSVATLLLTHQIICVSASTGQALSVVSVKMATTP